MRQKRIETRYAYNYGLICPNGIEGAQKATLRLNVKSIAMLKKYCQTINPSEFFY